MLNYQDILSSAQKLSPSEKARLIEELGAALRAELDKPSQPKRSLLGLWEGVTLSSEDIDEARQDLWKNFPREDIG